MFTLFSKDRRLNNNNITHEIPTSLTHIATLQVLYVIINIITNIIIFLVD